MTFTVFFCLGFAVLYTIDMFMEKDPVLRIVYAVGSVILCALGNLATALAPLVK